MQAPTVRSSFKQGITTETSGRVFTAMAARSRGDSDPKQMSATVFMISLGQVTDCLHLLLSRPKTLFSDSPDPEVHVLFQMEGRQEAFPLLLLRSCDPLCSVTLRNMQQTVISGLPVRVAERTNSGLPNWKQTATHQRWHWSCIRCKALPSRKDEYNHDGFHSVGKNCPKRA